MDHLSKYLALRIALERRQQRETIEPGGPGGGASDTGGPDGGGGESGVAGGGEGPEEPALPSLEGVSEKQYTIYIAPGGGAFTVSGCRWWSGQAEGQGDHRLSPAPSLAVGSGSVTPPLFPLSPFLLCLFSISFSNFLSSPCLSPLL